MGPSLLYRSQIVTTLFKKGMTKSIALNVERDKCLLLRLTGREGTHESNTNTHLCLNVERDEAVCDQVVDGLEPLLSDKVLPVMVETEVSRLVPKPGMGWRKKDEKKKNGNIHSQFGFHVAGACMVKQWMCPKSLIQTSESLLTKRPNGFFFIYVPLWLMHSQASSDACII